MASKTVRISLSTVRALAPGDENFDTTVRGFWARRRKGPSVSYGITYRTAEGRQRRYTIGPHGSPWTPDTARAEALRVLGEKVRGNDPAAVKKATRQAQTILDLCDLYWSDAEKGRLLTRSRRPKKPRYAPVGQGPDRQSHSAATGIDEDPGRHRRRRRAVSAGRRRREDVPPDENGTEAGPLERSRGTRRGEPHRWIAWRHLLLCDAQGAAPRQSGARSFCGLQTSARIGG